MVQNKFKVLVHVQNQILHAINPILSILCVLVLSSTLLTTNS
jgi:hypothetical protein